ncbi:hypothetical protein AAX09_02555 [Moraxella bovoculi]|uniref:UPF0149 family protein n=1 Tax=Moraxella bovoculi TaxID=386891 RepID=UPI00062489B5|nr:UPF0149 family protein [Moraxella bovoculi]AKG16724.1 hypothetical protein AAX10_02585 [Moraxella bovoculi]AKG18460.1 hypothetical protein AAX09_02555 [Moraxella bovoculi]NSM10975.1 UPF0149 family protein [Moraxella bovoculi]
MSDFLSGWDDWSAAFADWSDVSISELHGIMTGVMTACHATDEEGWTRLLEELSFALPNQKALELLTEYGEDVSFALKDKDDAYAYEPLVPDDEHDLYERVLALKDWAGGYITGIGVTGVSLTAEEREVIKDLSQIAAIRLDDEEEIEVGEEMWLHLFEFARMVPVSLSTKKRIDVMSLPIIKGLDINAKTAQEVAAQKDGALFVDAMAKKQ